jgi:hypothetical protein
MVEIGGLRTDAEKVVLRVRKDGVHWAMVRGSEVSWQGRTVGQRPASTSEKGWGAL